MLVRDLIAALSNFPLGALVTINTPDGPELVGCVEWLSTVVMLSPVTTKAVGKYQPSYTPEQEAAYKHEVPF